MRVGYEYRNYRKYESTYFLDDIQSGYINWSIEESDYIKPNA